MCLELVDATQSTNGAKVRQDALLRAIGGNDIVLNLADKVQMVKTSEHAGGGVEHFTLNEDFAFSAGLMQHNWRNTIRNFCITS